MTDTSAARAARAAARRADQDTNLFSRLVATATASRGQAKRLLHASAGLSITEWRILWDLAVAGPLSVQDMASIQRTDHSLISRALPVMRDKGYIKTARAADDKRQSLVDLTEAGRHVFAMAAPTMKRRRESLNAAFDDAEMHLFLNLLARFEALLDHPIEVDTPLQNVP